MPVPGARVQQYSRQSSRLIQYSRESLVGDCAFAPPMRPWAGATKQREGFGKDTAGRGVGAMAKGTHVEKDDVARIKVGCCAPPGLSVILTYQFAG